MLKSMVKKPGNKSMKVKIQKGTDNAELSAKARQQLTQAESRGYLVTRGFQQEVAKAWRACCEGKREPYLRIRLNGRRWATLYVDLEPTGQRFPRAINEAVYSLGQLASCDFVIVGSNYAFLRGFSPGQVAHLVRVLRRLLNLSTIGLQNEEPVTENGTPLHHDGA